jgi:osmotically-inducible protein OsmY
MMTDYQLSVEVKHEISGALRNAKRHEADRIWVEASDGTVVLGGLVKTKDERDKAEQVARATRGVRAVFNDIRVAA